MTRLLIAVVALLLIGAGAVWWYRQLSPSSAAIITPLASGKNLDSYTPTLPTLQTIFADDHHWTATLSAQHLRTIMATGDIIPARSVNLQVIHHQDFTWPYQKTYDLTRSADITFIDLETPLLDQCDQTDSGMVFCGDSRHVEGLVFAGVDVANLANNHAGNHGAEGVQHTKQLLETHGITTTGTGTIAIKTIRGLRFAFLGYNDITTPQPGIRNASEETITADIASARQQADVVIVTYHWGVEYRDQPDDRQKYLGHFTIDAGADLVIGNHPHWIQPIEIYKGKLITYAHGNFVFDQMWSEKTRLGVIGTYTFYDSNLIDVFYTPIRIDNYGQPIVLSANLRKPIIEEMYKQSAILSALYKSEHPT